jgi:hypothetical protein
VFKECDICEDVLISANKEREIESVDLDVVYGLWYVVGSLN